MNKDYYVKLSARLDDSSKTITALNKQIANLEHQIQKITIKADTTSLKKTNGEFSTLDEALKKINLTTQTLDKEFVAMQGKLSSADKETKKFKNSLGQVVEITTRMNGEEKLFSANITNLNSQLAKNTNTINNLNKQYKEQDEVFRILNQDISKFKEISSSTDTFGNITKTMSDNAGKIITLDGKMIDGKTKYIGKLKEVNQAVDVNAKQADKWHYSWSKAFQSFTTYMSVTTVFYQIKNGIEDMIDKVVDLDAALVELQKVTDLSGASLENFTRKAYDVGAEVAKTGTEMIDAATQFAKAGYDEGEILQLGKVASMYTNIADEELNAGDAAEFVIAQMKAFNIEASQAEHIIDAVNEVSNNFAVSSADIANNLGKSSAVMANAGNSYEQMIGLMTAGTEVTRNASKVANGLKTITLRLQGMDDEGEENLELFAQMEGLFNKLGISVYKADGSLKNTFEILETLAPAYREASAAEKAYITETIAGKYQAQNAAAILNNFNTAIEANETAMHSQGSAANENAKVLESIQGRISALKSSWEKLSQSVISSDFLKTIISFGTTLLNVADSGFGHFIGRATVTYGVLRLLTIAAGNVGKVFKSIQTTFVTLSNVIKTTGASYTSLSNIITLISNKEKIHKLQQELSIMSEKKQSVELSVLKGKMASYGISVEGVTSAEQAKIAVDKAAAASTMALNLALGGVSLILTAVISGVTAYNQAQAEARQAAIDGANALNQENEQLASSIDNIKKYKETLDSQSSSEEDIKTAKESLIGIQDDLIKTYGKEAEGLDLVNGKLEDQIKILDEAQKKKADKWLAENQAQIKKAQKKTTEAVDRGAFYYQGEVMGGRTPYSKKASSYIQQIAKEEDFDLSKTTSGYLKTDENAEKTLDFLYKLSERLRENKQAALDAGMSEKEYSYALVEVGTAINDIKDKYGEYIDIRDKEKQMQLEAKDGYKDFIRQVKDLGEEGKLTEGQYDALLKTFPGLGKALKDAGYDFEYFSKKYQDSTKSQENFRKELESDDTLKIAREEMDKLAHAGQLTKEAMDELIAKYPELKEAIESYFGDDSDISEKIANMFNVDLDPDGILGDYSSQVDEITSHINTLKTAIDEWNQAGYISAETMKALQDNGLLQYLSLENGQLVANTNELYNKAEAARVAASQDLTQAMIDDVLKVAEGNVEKASATAQAAVEGLGTKAGEAGAKAKDQVNNFIDFANAVDKANQALAGKNLTGKVKEEIGAVFDAYKPRFAALSTPVTVSPVSYSGSGSGGSGGGSRGGSSKSSSSSKAWWETQLEKLKEKFNYNEISIGDYIKGLEKILKKLKKGSEGWKKINEELQKQRLSKVEDDYKRGTISLDTYIKKLKELRSAYKKGTEAWNELSDKIKKALQDKAKKQQDNYNTSLKAANKLIDKQIDKLKEQQDAQEEYYDKLIEEKKKANDETEREIELARLQEALANAQKEKTKRVWREGIGKKSADIKDNYIGQMLEIVKTEVRLNLRWCVYG